MKNVNDTSLAHIGAQARLENAQADVIRTKYNYIFRLKILEFYFGIPIALN